VIFHRGAVSVMGLSAGDRP